MTPRPAPTRSSKTRRARGTASSFSQTGRGSASSSRRRNWPSGGSKWHSRGLQARRVGHEDRAHRPSQHHRRRYRPQHRVLQKGARHGCRDDRRGAGGADLWSAEDSSRPRGHRHDDARRTAHAGAYLLRDAVADLRGQGASRRMRRGGADGGAARRRDRHDAVGLYRRPRQELRRNFDLLTMADTLAHDETRIIETAFEDRVRDIFKLFAEAIYTGEPERDAAARFRRGLVSARRARAAALEVAKEA